MRSSIAAMLAATATFAVSACGGGSSGGGVGVQSTPVPPTAPTPAAAPVTIFASPAPGEYASIGASIAGPGGNLDTYQSSTDRFGPVSTSQADQAHVRYTTGGYYEVKLAGADWDRLVPHKGMVTSDPNNNYFQPAGVPQNYAYLVTRNSRTQGYSFSELGAWGSEAQGRWGYTAFGAATSPNGVPTSGSATFSGVVSGSTDAMSADNLYGGYTPIPTDGFVTLNFDFTAGSLNGRLDLFLPDGMNPIPLDSFAFTQTVFSPGSTSYSGRFDSPETGQNFFLGQFTGPNAQETIGAWAVPFRFDQQGGFIHGDGQVHQAFGAWVAKRGN